MKYVLMFVVAIILIRIDKVIEIGEKGYMMFQSEPAQQDKLAGLGDSPVIVRSETNVKLSPRQEFLAFLDGFKVSPDASYREQAISLFRDHPQMFSEKGDKNLEARIYAWRDLIVQNSEELPLFLLDLMNIMKGENKITVTRFFSLVMDLNIDMFMSSYPRTKDPACAPVTLIEAAVPPEERLPELYERMGILEEFLAKEKLPADKKLYANLCLNTLKIHLEKEGASAPPTAVETVPEEAPVAQPEAGTTP
jgi:hypothetical protein